MRYKQIGLQDKVHLKGGEKFVVVHKDGLMPDGRRREQGPNETNGEWRAYAMARCREVFNNPELNHQQIKDGLVKLLITPERLKVAGPRFVAADRAFTEQVATQMAALVMTARTAGRPVPESELMELFTSEVGDEFLRDGRLRAKREDEASEDWQAYCVRHVDQVLAQHNLTDMQIRQRLTQMFATPEALKGEEHTAARLAYAEKVGAMIDERIAKSSSARKLAKDDELIRSYYEKIWAIPVVLQANEVSRVHKMQEGQVFKRGASLDAMISFRHTFVVRHNWLAVLGDTNPELTEWELPFDDCVFEFKVGGHICIVHVSETKVFSFFIEVAKDEWFFLTNEDFELTKFLKAQIAACCVVLEAQVATHEVVRQPTALQAKREKAGKPRMLDYHVIDLSKKKPRVSNPLETPTPEDQKGRKRLHFCRGHWRQYPTHKTRIPWCLKGNPELGFVDKMYKL